MHAGCKKNNQLKQEKSVDAEIERLYRIATEHYHYKANINLQNGAMRGHFQVRGKEQLRLSEQLIGANVATGYLFVAYFLQQGSAGLKQDSEMALRYFRKAADEGNAQAQYNVAEKLAPVRIAPDIARQMRRCAAEQGHGKAAVALAVNLQTKGNFQEALEVLQMGVAAGDESAAGYLDDGFRGPDPSDDLHYFGQQEDLERADRYKKIWRILANYSYADPKVPEINEIVPLPPAKLPPWDGKLQWLEERLANVPPPKPDEALIRKLANEKQLDPATGRPLPASPHFIKATGVPLMCNSGQACPQSGYWEAVGLTFGYAASASDGGIRLFKQGESMPKLVVQRSHRRLWPLSDRVTTNEETIRWCFYGEA
ncbi:MULTISPECIES: DUF6396 domain-containing protein [unclassified Pseudomonas]|uniref:SEL1-like repeat protein n=1 Tax=Pseudomonas sp. BJa5 TaxID=2936270 RepID=UPI00333AFC6E